AIHEGPATFDATVTLGALPTYVREGAILPRAPLVQWSDQAPADTLDLELYPAAAPTTLALYEDDGRSFAYQQGQSSQVTYTLQRTTAGATLAVSGRVGAWAPPPR